MTQSANNSPTAASNNDPVAESASIGIAWMLATMFWFTSLDAIAKYLLQSYPVIQVVWARFFFHTLFVVIVMRRTLSYEWRSSRPTLQLSRSVLMLTTTALFFVGVQTTPLTMASTILFLSPIFVTVLAIPILGEKVGIRRWMGVLFGFAGAMIVVRPTVSGLAFGSVLLLAAALSNAFYQVVTRQVRHADTPMTSLFYSGLFGAIITTLIVPFFWVVPTLTAWGCFLLLGLLGSVGHLCLIRSLRRASASVVVPFSYSSLIWATMYGFLLWGDLPTSYTLTGASLIIGSGFYIFHRERIASRKSA